MSDNGSFPGSDLVTATNQTALIYWFVVSNDGNAAMINIFLDDPILEFSTNLGALTAGQVTVAVHDVVNGNITNLVTVTGEDPGGRVNETSDTAEVIEFVPPTIVLEKSVYLGHDNGASCPGLDLIIASNSAQITYCYIISNDGEELLTNIVLRDVSLPVLSM